MCKYQRILFEGEILLSFVRSRSNADSKAAQRKTTVKNSNPGGSSQANLALLNSSDFYCFGIPFFFFLFFLFFMCIFHGKEVTEFSGSWSFHRFCYPLNLFIIIEM